MDPKLTHQQPTVQIAQACCILGIAIAGLAPVVVDMMSHQNTECVCSSNHDKGGLIACTIEGISATELGRWLQRLGPEPSY